MLKVLISELRILHFLGFKKRFCLEKKVLIMDDKNMKKNKLPVNDSATDIRKQKNKEKFPRDIECLNATEHLSECSAASSTADSSAKLIDIELSGKKREMIEQEEREIRRRARREASLDALTGEFAPTIFEQVDAPIKPVTNFECFRKKRESTDSPPSPLSKRKRKPLLPMMLAMGGFLCHNENTADVVDNVSADTQSPASETQRMSEQDETNIDPEDPDNSVKNSNMKEQKHFRKLIKRLFSPSKHQSEKEDMDIVKEKERSLKVQKSLKENREQTADQSITTSALKTAIPKSIYLAPVLTTEHRLDSPADMGYYDIATKNPSVTKKSRETTHLNVRKTCTKEAKICQLKSTSSMVKQPSPSSNATKRRSGTLFKKIKHSVGIIGEAVSAVTSPLHRFQQQSKEQDIPNVKDKILKEPQKNTPTRTRSTTTIEKLRDTRVKSGTVKVKRPVSEGKVFTTKTGERYIYIKRIRKNKKGQEIVQYIPQLLK